MGQSDFTQPVASGGGATYPETPMTADGAISTPGLYTNTGAGVTVTATVDNVPGMPFFMRRTAAQEFRLAPPVGKQIHWSGEKAGMAIDEYLSLEEIGASIEGVVATNGDIYILGGEIGKVVEQNP